MASSDTIIVFMLSFLGIGLMFMVAQVAISEVNPDAGQVLGDCGQNPLSYAVGNHSGNCGSSTGFSLRQPGSDDLPSANAQTSPTTGNIFTDTFSAGKNWALHATGVGYVVDIISAPAYFLNALGLPPVVSYGIAGIFYMVLLFLIASWLLGR